MRATMFALPGHWGRHPAGDGDGFSLVEDQTTMSHEVLLESRTV
jgi:hypothetical protein